MRDFHFESGTHIKDNNTTMKMMMHLLIALLPIVIFSFYKNGVVPYVNDYVEIYGLFKPLIMILVSMATGVLVEYLYYHFIMKGTKTRDFLKDSYGFLPGLFLALTLPVNTPLLIVIVGSILASIIGKMIFGGFGNNILNPALVGRLLIMSLYASVILKNGGYLNGYELDTISSATPLTNASFIKGIGDYQTLVAPYGNLWNFLIGTIPGSLGETSALLCIIGFIYLTINKVIKWVIPVAYVGTVFIITFMIGNYNDLGLWYPIFHVLSGGLMFGAVFMATDPVTSPSTPVGELLYGLFLGILTVFFRFLTPEPEGVLTSILTMNLFIFMIDHIGLKSRFKFRHAVIPFVVAWSLIFGLGIYISTDIGNEVVSDFKVEQKIIIDNMTTYVVTGKGYESTIKAKITFIDSKVTGYEVLEQAEGFYQATVDLDYLNTLISNQSDLPNVDTVSNATFTSNALKQLLIDTINDYKESR